MIPLVLIEGEFRSLIRNTLERFIGKKVKRKIKNGNLKIIYKLSIRVVASLIAIFTFNNIKEYTDIRTYVSYILVGFFIYFLVSQKN